jgi:hypothetical protein
MDDQDPYVNLPEDNMDDPYANLPDDNVIDHPENILKKAAKGLESFKDFSKSAQYGFINTASFGIPEMIEKRTGMQISPETENPAGETVGDILGFMAGGPEIVGKGAAKLLPKANAFVKGATKMGAGTASLSPANLMSGDSSLEKEGVKVGAASLLGGSLEGASSALFKGTFGKNIAHKQMQTLGKELGDMKEAIKKDPNAVVDATSLLQRLQTIYDNVADPLKPKLVGLKNWINDLLATGTSKILGPNGQPIKTTPIVGADFVRQMEENLGSLARYTSQKGGIFQFLKKPIEPTVNKALQYGRTIASETYDDAALKAGFPEFAPKSKQVSSILKKYPDMDPSKGGGSQDLLDPVAVAIATAQATKNPFLSLIAYGAKKATQVPQARQSVFDALTSKTGQAVTETGSKIGRGVTNKLLQSALG